MVFKWRINRPAFQAAANGVDVMHPGIETEFETVSIAEAHCIFTDSATALAEMFGSTLMGGVNGLTETISGEPDTNEQTPARRGRKPKDKSQPDPSTAAAPAPVTIPGIAPTIDTTPGPNGIPAFLDATKQASAATAAISAPPPPAPPAAPVAPPTGIVAGKIVAELERRAVGSVDNGQGLADWLSTTGITIKGASFEEAVKVMRLQPDEKLGQIAGLLGV